MKKVLGCLLAAVTMLSSFTACDKDEKESMRLSGEWQGDFYATYNYYYKAERTPRTAYADLTYMQFQPDHLFGSTRGTGIEVDIYNSGPIAYMRYEFDWRVDEGHIYLSYWDAPEMDVVIDDYRLTYNRFRGHFGENNNTIDLYKMDSWDGSIYVSSMEMRADNFIADYNNWHDYVGGRNVGTRAAEGEEESFNPEDLVIVSRGRALKSAK